MKKTINITLTFDGVHGSPLCLVDDVLDWGVFQDAINGLARERGDASRIKSVICTEAAEEPKPKPKSKLKVENEASHNHAPTYIQFIDAKKHVTNQPERAVALIASPNTLAALERIFRPGDSR